MSGFLVHPAADSSAAPWPVSLGDDRPRHEHEWNGFRVAIVETAHPGASRPVEMADGVLWLDGDARPMPEAGTSYSEWLEIADGSFRGVFFPLGGTTCEIIADPYASLPVFYTESGRDACASDKLASLTRVGGRSCEIRWDVVLEALAIGSAPLPDTSLAGIAQLEAACRVVLERGSAPRVQPYRAEHPASGEPLRRGLWSDARALQKAVRAAVSDTWRDSETALLLSGGFDSRWLLNHGPTGTTAITLAYEDSYEVELARRLAASSGARHTVVRPGRERWLHWLREGHLLTGAMFDPVKMFLMWDAAQLAREGYTTICHGFMFDTLLKGYFVFPRANEPSAVPDVFPGVTYHLASSVFTPVYVQNLLDHLSDEGRQQLSVRLHALLERVPGRICGGYDFGYERQVLQSMSRYTEVVAFAEHLDVKSPVFHKDLWRWYRESRPGHRAPALGYLLAFLLGGGRSAWTPRADTNERAIRLFLRAWIGKIVSPEAKARVKALLRSNRSPQSASTESSAPAAPRTTWGFEVMREVFQDADGRAVIAEHLEALEDVPVFRRDALGRLMNDFESGKAVDPRFIAFLASIGAWTKRVQH